MIDAGLSPILSHNWKVPALSVHIDPLVQKIIQDQGIIQRVVKPHSLQNRRVHEADKVPQRVRSPQPCSSSASATSHANGFANLPGNVRIKSPLTIQHLFFGGSMLSGDSPASLITAAIHVRSKSDTEYSTQNESGPSPRSRSMRAISFGDL